MPIAYQQVIEGEWFTPRKRGWRMACCHCGLVHRVNFRVNAHGQVQMQVYIDGPATGGKRRKKHRCNCQPNTARG